MNGGDIVVGVFGKSLLGVEEVRARARVKLMLLLGADEMEIDDKVDRIKR